MPKRTYFSNNLSKAEILRTERELAATHKMARQYGNQMLAYKLLGKTKQFKDFQNKVQQLSLHIDFLQKKLMWGRQ